MASSTKRVLVAHFVVLGCLWGLAATGQTPDGVPPANEGVCDELQMATPGLYGLCVAFCEAQDCVPDFEADDPFANCTPSSPKLLEVYNRKKQPDDPEMPCVQQESCPCWTEAELDQLPFLGSDDDPTKCVLDGSFGEITNLDLWEIEDSTLVSTFESSGSAKVCFLGSICPDDDVGCPVVNRLFFVTPAEFAACEAGVSRSGADRGFSCFQ